MRKERGFSIIEVVLVLGVIGILSTLIVPKTRRYLAMAKDTKAINLLNNVRIASENYYLENGVYVIDGEIGESGSEITNTEMEKLKNYMKNSFKTSENVEVEIGGSKEEKNSEDIKYGGKLKMYMDKNKEIHFKLSEGIEPYSIRGEKWEEI